MFQRKTASVYVKDVGVVLAFGAMWIRRSMPMFWRHVVSIFRAEVTRQGSSQGSQSFFLIGSLPSAFAPQILHKPFTSLPHHFSPEDGDSMCLQNVGKRQNPRQHQHYNNHHQNLKSHLFEGYF
jgi:hypothetical protein